MSPDKFYFFYLSGILFCLGSDVSIFCNEFYNHKILIDAALLQAKYTSCGSPTATPYCVALHLDELVSLETMNCFILIINSNFVTSERMLLAG